MENHSIIGHEESKNIILDFFGVDFNFYEIVKRFHNKNSSLIISHIKEIFKKMILDIESQLMLAQKIESMQIYENNSDQMFNEFMNIRSILNQQDICNLQTYYRATTYKGSHYKSDLISSEKRLNIYKAFLKYALINDLFKFAIVEQKISPSQQMVSDPLDLYSRQALSIIYKFYEQQDGNLQKIQKMIRIQGKYISAKYRGEMFKYNIKNIMLIGLFRVYKIVLKSLDKSYNGWQSFSKKYQCTLENFDFYWRKILLRIAIQDNPKMEQLRQVAAMLNQKFHRKEHQVFKARMPKREKDKRERQQSFKRSLKNELSKMIRYGKK